MSWFISNSIVVALLALGVWLFAAMRRREYWRLAGRELLAKKSAVVSGAILAAYLLVAVLDSVGWRNAERDPATGEVRRNPQSGAVIYDRGASVLDRLLRPLSRRQELYYSAPLAREAYIYETQETGEGGAQRLHPKLQHPRTHLLGTDRIGNDVLLLSLKSIRTGIIIGLLTTLIAIPFALLMGILAGYFGGWLDDIIQYLYTVVSSIPTVLFVAAFIVIFGVGLPQLCVAMGLASWTASAGCCAPRRCGCASPSSSRLPSPWARPSGASCSSTSSPMSCTWSSSPPCCASPPRCWPRRC